MNRKLLTAAVAGVMAMPLATTILWVAFAGSSRANDTREVGWGDLLSWGPDRGRAQGLRARQLAERSVLGL